MDNVSVRRLIDIIWLARLSPHVSDNSLGEACIALWIDTDHDKMRLRNGH